MDSTRIMREQKVPRLLVTYSAPVFLSYLCNSIYNIISRAYIGNGSAGHLGIAALSVAFPIFTGENKCGYFSCAIRLPPVRPGLRAGAFRFQYNGTIRIFQQKIHK